MPGRGREPACCNAASWPQCRDDGGDEDDRQFPAFLLTRVAARHRPEDHCEDGEEEEGDDDGCSCSMCRCTSASMVAWSVCGGKKHRLPQKRGHSTVIPSRSPTGSSVHSAIVHLPVRNRLTRLPFFFGRNLVQSQSFPRILAWQRYGNACPTRDSSTGSPAQCVPSTWPTCKTEGRPSPLPSGCVPPQLGSTILTAHTAQLTPVEVTQPVGVRPLPTLGRSLPGWSVDMYPVSAVLKTERHFPDSSLLASCQLGAAVLLVVSNFAISCRHRSGCAHESPLVNGANPIT